MELSYYQLLKVSPTATTAEIKKAYIKASKEHHPDTAGADAAAMFDAVTNAKNILIDPVARESYDAELTRQNSGTNQTRATGESARERSEPWNEYASRNTAEERTRYDAGSREYAAAQRAARKASGRGKWRLKSPSLLLFSLVGWFGYGLADDVAKVTGLQVFSKAGFVGALITAAASLICARFIPKELSKKFWAGTRRKAGGILSRRVSSAKSAPTKVNASK